ncbi:MAG: aromatic ring-hydroxylating oxygenase subunit alpha [Actinomycetota bacterium]
MDGTAQATRDDWKAEADSLTNVDRRFFVDDDLFTRELERVFARCWEFVAHESEVPEVGSYVTRTMGRDSVIVIRDDAGAVRVMLNSCTHRGTQLCKTPIGNASSFRCGYHGWTFNNNGDLFAVPRLSESYAPTWKKSDHGLVQARVEVFHGLVFATWNHEGPDLVAYLGDMAWYLEAMMSMAPGGFEVIAPPQRYIQDANWKFPVENDGGDGYHLPVAHGTMFDLDIFGTQAGNTAGHVVQTKEGHVLRRQYLRDEFPEPPYFGYPADTWATITKGLTAEQAAFVAKNTVIHGTVFPNSAFVVAAFPTTGDPGDEEVSIYTWRVHRPLTPHTAEVVYWLFVARGMSDAWKRASYKTQVRIFSGAAFFEADDYENFARIDRASDGARGRETPFNYTLGLDAPDETNGNGVWPGPGSVQARDVSEANQRAFYRRYLELMEDPS